MNVHSDPPPGNRMGSIADILSKGDIVDGHRSRERAKELLPEFKRALDFSITDHRLDKAMLEFIVEVVLGAAWYQKRYRSARSEVHRYILLNCIAVAGLPIALLGLLWLGEYWSPGSNTSVIVTQLTGVLTGVLGLQKTLSSWYASQRRFATWYKSASDLKSLYYSLIQQWDGNVAKDQPGCLRALAVAASSARQIIANEQLDYFQNLALPSFDVLDLLTATQSKVSGLITSLLPGVRPATIATGPKNNAAAASPKAPPAAAPRAVPGPTALAITPGGPVPRSSVYRAAPGVTVAFKPDLPAATPGPGAGASAAANWITYASVNTDGKSIASFRSTWTVPNGPFLTENQTIFLFNGAQTGDRQTIVQPVLQWGDSYLDNEDTNDIGPFWTIASWAVVDGTRHITKHQRVSVGQTLTGLITLEQQTDAGYTYSCEFDGIDGTRLSVCLPTPLVNCVEVLEAYEQSNSQATWAYDLFDRQEYPNATSIDFTNIDITVAAGGAIGTWTTESPVNSYGERTSITANAATNGAVSIVVPLQTS